MGTSEPSGSPLVTCLLQSNNYYYTVVSLLREKYSSSPFYELVTSAALTCHKSFCMQGINKFIA